MGGGAVHSGFPISPLEKTGMPASWQGERTFKNGRAHTSETMDSVLLPPHSWIWRPGRGPPPPLTTVPGFGGYFQMAALPTPACPLQEQSGLCCQPPSPFHFDQA